MKKSIGIILMVLLFLSMATGLGFAIGALVAAEDAEQNIPYIKDGNWWIGDIDTGIHAAGDKVEIKDGTWWINGEDTGISAEGTIGLPGTTPTIEIKDGTWWINGVNTGKPAEGGAPSVQIKDGTWWINGVDTGEPATPGTTPSISFEVKDGWFYIKVGSNEAQPLYNIEYDTSDPKTAAENAIAESIDELTELLESEQSEAVKQIINEAIEELNNTDLTNVDSIENANQIIKDAKEIVEDVKDEVLAQQAKEVNIVIKLESEVIAQYIAEKGQVVTEPTVALKEGHTLKWYVEGQEYDFTTLLEADIEIVGKYEVNTYEITYTIDNQLSDHKDAYKYGENAVITITNPEKEGYTFIGWVDANDNAYEVKPMPVDGIELFAKFTANKYEITYDLGYEANLDKLVVEYGEAYELAKPERAGYKFVGWYYNGQLLADGEAWAIASDVTLVADWEGFNLNTVVDKTNVKFNVTAIDGEQIEHINTIEIVIKVKTAEVKNLTGQALLLAEYNNQAFIKSAQDGEYTVYTVTFYAEAELKVEDGAFAEINFELAEGVDTITAEITSVIVNGRGEGYVGSYDVEYENSISVERNL